MCSPEYALKFCDCIPNPSVPGQTMCGYINRRSGLVYGCDVGCCPKCPNQGPQPLANIELRKGAATLPAGFGDDMIYSSTETVPPGAAPFVPDEDGPYKVRLIFMVLLVLLLIVLILA